MQRRTINSKRRRRQDSKALMKDIEEGLAKLVSSTEPPILATQVQSNFKNNQTR